MLRPTRKRDLKMKRKLFYLFVATIVVITVLNINISSNKERRLDFLSMNVEALANDESATDGDCSKEGGECSVKLPQGSQLIIKGIQTP